MYKMSGSDTELGGDRHSEKAEQDYAASAERTARYTSKNLAHDPDKGHSYREVHAFGLLIYEHGNMIDSLEASAQQVKSLNPHIYDMPYHQDFSNVI